MRKYMTVPPRADHSRLDLNKQKILIIDPDPRVLSTLVGFLSDEPYDVCTAENAKEGLKILRREKIALAIAEKDIAGLDGVALLTRVAAEKIQTILTAGAVSVLDKPIVSVLLMAPNLAICVVI